MKRLLNLDYCLKLMQLDDVREECVSRLNGEGVIEFKETDVTNDSERSYTLRFNDACFVGDELKSLNKVLKVDEKEDSMFIHYTDSDTIGSPFIYDDPRMPEYGYKTCVYDVIGEFVLENDVVTYVIGRKEQIDKYDTLGGISGKFAQPVESLADMDPKNLEVDVIDLSKDNSKHAGILRKSM